MWDGDHMSGGWWWSICIAGLFLLVTFVVIVVVMARPDDRGAAPGARPEDVLADRFARGEIDDDEYRRRRDALRG